MTPIAQKAVVVESSLIILAWGIGYLVKIPLWQEVKPTWLALLWSILATLPLLTGMVWTVHTCSPMFAELRRFVQKRVVPLFADFSFWEMALIALLAGVGEELLFRGIL